MSTNNSNSKLFFVKGMHCSACETLINGELKELPNVKKVKVSLKNGTVKVFTKKTGHFPKLVELNKIFESAGYVFANDPFVEKEALNSKLKALVIVVFLGISYIFIERTGILFKFSLSNNSTVFSYFIFGLIAGISSCAALVGGLLVSASKIWNTQNQQNRYKPFFLFNSGRLLSYSLLGGFLGALGQVINLNLTFTSILTILTSLFILVIALQMLGVTLFSFSFADLPSKIKDSRFKKIANSNYFPTILGFSTFIIPCGFTLIAQANVISTQSFTLGALSLGAFALGTLPSLVLISFFSVSLSSNAKFNGVYNLVVGSLLLLFSIYTINSQLNLLGSFSFSDLLSNRNKGEVESANTKSVIETNGDVQFMQLQASQFDYFPKEITIKANTKTKLEIYANNVVGCAQALYAQGLYNKVVYLKQGYNTVEFVSPKPGKYKISCSMGMVSPVSVTVL